MRILRLSLLIVLFGAMLAACTTDQVTAEEIMERMKAAREQLQTVHAVADITLTTPDRNGMFTVEGWAQKTDATDADGQPTVMTRAKVLAASEAELVNTEFVNDGETFWLYNPAANKVLTGKLSELRHGRAGAGDPMEQMLRMQEMLQRLLDDSDVTLESRDEQVAGRDAWRVRLTPKAETQQELQLGTLITTVLWIDQESDLPVKASVDARDQGRLAATATTLELNQPLPADLFRFTPPAGAEIVNVAELAKQLRPETTTLDDARANVSFPLLTPAELPAGVQLDDVQLMRMRGETVIQNFSGTLNFSLVQSQGDMPGNGEPPAGAEVQQVEVRGQGAEMITGGSGVEQGTLLRWREDGVTVVIAGTLSPAQAIELAESLQHE